MDFVLEVIGFNIESCIAAQANGAGRIELCASPCEGGTTPSYAFIKAARKILNIPLYVMIRPRGGNFLYSKDEFSIMLQDIAICKQSGCDGIVMGILNADGSVNKDQCSLMVESAYPMGVTFHRAFDRVKNAEEALADVIATGCERILTSGLHPRAEDGMEKIARLVQIANGEIIIMPGSGIHSGNIKKIIQSTGVKEVHSSASVSSVEQMDYKNPVMKETLTHVIVNGEEVKKMRDVLKKM